MNKAIQQLEEAGQQRKALEDNLAELLAEVPQESVGCPHELVRRTKALLDRLESGRFAINADMPEDVVAAMTSVHEFVNSMEPVPAATLNSPLETPGVLEEESPEKDGEGDAAMATSEVIGKLDDIDDSDSEALLAIARRLKRARRT